MLRILLTLALAALAFRGVASTRVEDVKSHPIVLDDDFDEDEQNEPEKAAGPPEDVEQIEAIASFHDPERFRTRAHPWRQVLPGFFIGLREAAQNLDLLRAAGFSHVVICASQLVTTFADITYLFIGIDDHEAGLSDIAHFIYTFYTFLMSATGGRVLIVCLPDMAGLLLQALVMWEQGLSVEEAAVWLRGFFGGPVASIFDQSLGAWAGARWGERVHRMFALRPSLLVVPMANSASRSVSQWILRRLSLQEEQHRSRNQVLLVHSGHQQGIWVALGCSQAQVDAALQAAALFQRFEGYLAPHMVYASQLGNDHAGQQLVDEIMTHQGSS